MSNNSEQRIKEYRHKRRQEIISNLYKLKLTLKCELCSENHVSTLDFHHTDPSLKDFSISDAIRNRLSWTRIEKEISKCQILCSNCHRKLHYEMRHEENENNIRNTNLLKVPCTKERSRTKEGNI